MGHVQSSSCCATLALPTAPAADLRTGRLQMALCNGELPRTLAPILEVKAYRTNPCPNGSEYMIECGLWPLEFIAWGRLVQIIVICYCCLTCVIVIVAAGVIDIVIVIVCYCYWYGFCYCYCYG